MADNVSLLSSERPTRKRRRLIPFVADARQLAPLLCLSIRSIRNLDAAAKLPAGLRIGGRKVWLLSEIRDWLNAGAPDRGTWAALRAARK
jgi:hypothetical protein